VSYTVLALKWRPRRFADLVGQQHVVQALVNSLAAQRLHHAYLFAGTRGVGKTTLARILAKALNCEQGVVTEPCGQCDACVAIDEGRFVDLLEVDAASRTRVDDTRELLDNVQYAPSRGRYKVYLIDEVHMLSTHSFNALLKTLEEPPPHVKFLLATTDPQKLPITVLSRCLQFNLKKLTIAQIRDQLEKICVSEGISFEPDALTALAEAATGSLRDAQSLLDQAIAFGAGEVRGEQVNAMLGTIDRSQVLRILAALAGGNGVALVRETDALDERAADFGAALDELMSALQRMAAIQLVGERDEETDPAELEELAAQISPEDVQLYYQIALQGRRDLAVCRDARMGFEMTLLRMLAFRPVGAGDGDAPLAARRAVGTSRARTADMNLARERSDEPRSRDGGHASTAARTPDTPVDVPDGREHDAHDVAAGSARETSAESWAALLSAADVRGMARQLADHCEIASMTAGRIELVLRSDKAHLQTEQIRGRLEAALAEHLGSALRLKITVGEPPRPTPADRRLANETLRMRAARESIEQDSNVQALGSAFDAVLEADSIHPLESGTER
jgi:DNA polymerase III subunit gamma/tau